MTIVGQKKKQRKTAPPAPERLAIVIRPHWPGDIDRAVEEARALQRLAMAAPSIDGIPRARAALSKARAEVTRGLLMWLRTGTRASVTQLDQCGKQVHLALLGLKDLWWIEQVLLGLEMKRGLPLGGVGPACERAEVITLHALPRHRTRTRAKRGGVTTEQLTTMTPDKEGA